MSGIGKNNDELLQLRLNALAAKHQHVRRANRLTSRNLIIELLAIAVPAFYVALRFLSKGTSVEHETEFAWEILAACLLALATMRLVFKWQDRQLRHVVLARMNADVAREALEMVGKPTLSREALSQFHRRIQEIDTEDEELARNGAVRHLWARPGLSPSSVSLAC